MAGAILFFFFIYLLNRKDINGYFRRVFTPKDTTRDCGEV